MPKRTSLAARAAQDTAAPSTQPAAPAASPAASLLWSEEPPRQEVLSLDVVQIMPNRHQPRTIFDRQALEELAASIREHGVIQPIIVRSIPLTKWDGHARRYELIAGERRWRASMLAHQPTIPALIRADAHDHKAMIELALIENLQRADLHPLEEARAFGVMREELGYSYRQIAERVGRSKGYVQNRLHLLDLPDDLGQLVSERSDTLLHVIELAKVVDREGRAALIAAVRDDALSYQETQARVRALLAPPPDNATEEVYLRKYTHERDQGGDHGASAVDEARAQAQAQATPPDRQTAGDDVPGREDQDAEVYLRKYTHERDWAGVHGVSVVDATEAQVRPATGDVPVRTDSHERDWAGVHDVGAADEPRERGLSTSTDAGEVSVRQDSHERDWSGAHGAAAIDDTEVQAPPATILSDRSPSDDATPGAEDAVLLTLSAQERTMLLGLGEKLEHWLASPARLTAADREFLHPIALRLSVLLQRLHE